MESYTTKLQQEVFPQIESTFPNLHFFDIAGQKVYPLYAPNGSLTSRAIAYLCDRKAYLGGIDPKDSHIINFDPPSDSEKYVVRELNGGRYAAVWCTPDLNAETLLVIAKEVLAA